MSKFKIFGGIYQDERGIIEADSILYVSLEGSRVVIATKYDTEHSFETDLEDICEVMVCLRRAEMTDYIEFSKSSIGGSL